MYFDTIIQINKSLKIIKMWIWFNKPPCKPLITGDLSQQYYFISWMTIGQLQIEQHKFHQ